MLRVTPDIQIPLAEFQFSFVRSAGPGGQNVNKVASKAVMRWSVVGSPSLTSAVRARFLTRYTSRITTTGEVVITSQQYRDQGRNRDDCLEKLRQMLASVATAPQRRKKTRPSRGAVERRLESKQRNSQRKSARRAPPE